MSKQPVELSDDGELSQPIEVDEKPKRKRGESALTRSINVPIYALLALVPVIVIGLVVFVMSRVFTNPFDVPPEVVLEIATQMGFSAPTPTPIGECAINPPQAGERIAYVNEVGDRLYIYSLTTGDRCIVLNGATADPALSPDGTRIAFSTQDGVNTDIRVIDLNTGSDVNLTLNVPEPASDPTWSPDGTRVAFTLLEANTESVIWAINMDQTNPRRLTPGFDPAWSPDGLRLAFVGDNPNDVSYITIVNADGSGRDRLSENTTDEQYPSWSPEGTRILFARTEENNIYYANPDVNPQEYRLVAADRRNITDLQWLTEERFAYVSDNILLTALVPPYEGANDERVILENVIAFDWWTP